MKKWLTGQAPLRNNPAGMRLLDIPPYTIVDATGVQLLKNGILWTGVVYNMTNGYVYDGYLEDYSEQLATGVVGAEHPTPNPYDAAQFILLNGEVLHNACGEFCMAYIGGEGIDRFLEKWQIRPGSWFKRIVLRDLTTGLADLDDMSRTYEFEPPNLRFDAGLFDKVIGSARLTPGRTAKMLETHQLIAGVKIDHYGRLEASGIGHWVVLESVQPDGVDGGMAYLYNPYWDKMEMYSWQDFKRSVGSSLGGLWMKRAPIPNGHAVPSPSPVSKGETGEGSKSEVRNDN